MTALLQPKTREQHRRRSSSGDQRATALRMAGLELLACSDFEEISIAKLAKRAGCSVGAFYYRYPDKNAYLKQLIAATFRELENRLANNLRISGNAKRAPTITLSEFLSPIITRLSLRESAGVIRAALKLGATEPEALHYYEEYRQRVTEQAKNIFKGGSKKKIRSQEIGEAIQVVFAAINDAALMPESAEMELGSEKMTEALCVMAANHFGVKPDFKGRITATALIEENNSEKSQKTTKSEIKPKKKQPAQRRQRNVRVL